MSRSCAAQVALRQNKALLGEKGILPVKPYLDGWERSILGQKGESQSPQFRSNLSTVACYECCLVSTCVNFMSYIHAGVAPKEAGSWREKVRCFSELPTLFWFCARDRLVSTAREAD